jgi:hypothetical protein
MSLPVSTLQQTSGCIPVSANCVIWPGPDIACIGLCKGDTVTKAIASLAQKLCDSTAGVIDVSTFDLSCLITEEQQAPESLAQLLQLMISKICEEVQPEAPVDPETSQIALPPCLVYESEGVPVTALPIEEYAALLATNVCALIGLTGNHNTVIGQILERLLALESATSPEFNETQISAQCISSETPGEVIPVSQAVINIESYLCALKEVLGENTNLGTAVTSMCAGLGTKPSLSNPAATMNQLAGWTASPSTVAETLQNLWITVCDIRSKLENC